MSGRRWYLTQVQLNGINSLYGKDITRVSKLYKACSLGIQRAVLKSQEQQ